MGISVGGCSFHNGSLAAFARFAALAFIVSCCMAGCGSHADESSDVVANVVVSGSRVIIRPGPLPRRLLRDGRDFKVYDATDEMVRQIFSYATPIVLDASGSPSLSAKPFTGLQHPKMLLELRLNFCSLMDSSIVSTVLACESMERLELAGCHRIEPGKFAALHRLARLETLVLSGCRVNDVDLRALGASPSLQRIELWACTLITIEGVEALLLAPQLTFVDLTQCTQLPHAEVAALKRAFSNVHIVAPNE